MAGRILIVDDLVTNRIILKVKLNAACHEVLQAANGQEALRLARDEQPRLILLDMGLPDLSGIEVCRQLRADPLTRHTPIILISASTQRNSRLEALAAGADDFLAKPLNESLLMARIRSLLRVSQTDADLRQRAETCHAYGLSEAATGFEHPPAIALVTGQAGLALSWRKALSVHLPGRYLPMTAAEALASAAGPDLPDLYVIASDIGSPGDSLRLIADLRARTGSRPAGLCLALDEPEHEQASLALDLGASDLVPMPGDPQETALRLRLQLSRQRRVEALRQAVRQGLELAATDPLTGLYNRRYALARLDRIAQQAVETGAGYAVMILDIDRFKQVNDRYGHAAGDAVLLTVAGRLRAALRPSDLLARIGGEEFLVVLPDASLASARAVAERLRAAVSDTPVALPDGLGSVAVTLSAGLTLAAGNIALPLADPLPMTTGTDPLDGDRRPGIGAGHWPSRQDGGQIAAHCAAARDGAIGWHSHVAVPDSDAADRDGEPLPTGLAAPGPSGTLGTSRPGTQTPTGSIAGPEIRPADPFSGSLHPPGQGVRAALARADAALLLAKAEGRNQITVSSAA